MNLSTQRWDMCSWGRMLCIMAYTVLQKNTLSQPFICKFFHHPENGNSRFFPHAVVPAEVKYMLHLIYAHYWHGNLNYKSNFSAHIYSRVDSEIPPPISSALTEYLRRRLSEILPRRGSDFLQESPSSTTNRRTNSIEIIPYTSDQPSVSAPRYEQKYTTMTGHLSGKGKSFWSRGVSATPTPSEAESRASSPLPQVTQRPQYLDLPGTSQAGLNLASQDGSHTHSIDSHHQIESEQEQYQALEGSVREVFGNGVNQPLQPHEDVTPTTERVVYNSDPWTVFSLISNGKNIFRFEDSSANLQSLYGIKFLSVLWVLIGHAFLVTESLPAMNYVTIKNVSIGLSS